MNDSYDSGSEDENFLSLDFASESNERDEVQVEKDDAEDSDDMDVSDDEGPESDLPPWLSKRIDRRTHPLVALHNEIVAFCKLIEPTQKEIAERDSIVEEFRHVVRDTFGEGAELEVFGSQATGLFLPSSDIDCVILMDKVQESSTNDDGGEFDATAILASPLQRLALSLRESWKEELSYLEVIENTAVPLVKFTHATSGVSFDVSFNEEKGPTAAKLMKTYMEALPPLRPLTFVLKYFLKARGLNEPYSGGIGSFLLQLMIVAHLQHRERDSRRFGRPTSNDLGSLLIEFLVLYGFDFNYYTCGISVRYDGFFFPKGAEDKRKTFVEPTRPFLLSMENPLDISMDVGSKSFRIQLITRAFGIASRMLIAHTTHPVERTDSILSTILPVSQDMIDRKK